jgi:hypothetical protein
MAEILLHHGQEIGNANGLPTQEPPQPTGLASMNSPDRARPMASPSPQPPPGSAGGDLPIDRWIKTPCGRSMYRELAARPGGLARLRLGWFVVIAVLRDWPLPNPDQAS